jgi:hypothetical protein
MNKLMLARGVNQKLRHVRNYVHSLVPRLKAHALKQLKVAADSYLPPEYVGEGKRRPRPHALKFKM